MTEALVYLHYTCKVIHRNISPQSILINKKGTWKLAGLEFVEKCHETDVLVYVFVCVSISLTLSLSLSRLYRFLISFACSCSKLSNKTKIILELFNHKTEPEPETETTAFHSMSSVYEQIA